MTDQIDNDQLTQKLAKAQIDLEKLTSLRFQFLRGIFSGLGSAIGATVIFAILIIFLDRILRELGEVPVLTPILEFINRSIGQ